jgi:membrane fusion protein (multidrug efflux system)
MNSRKLLLSIVGALLVVGFGGRSFYNGYKFEETDNARTAAHSSVLSTKVGGVINEILVRENQTVKEGDVILRLDQRDYVISLDRIEADLKSIQVKLQDADRNYRRMKTLLASDTVSRQTYEAAETQYLDLVRQEESLKTQVAQAKLNLEHTELRAPTDGRVGRRNIEKGVVVGPGQPLIAFVQSDEFWVVANFKETQLKDIKIGQNVDVHIDAIGGHVFEGKVESFSPGSGATFAVIPADNATGNFVKIVQRVPVKIILEKRSMKGFEDRLVPGLSVIAKVQVH